MAQLSGKHVLLTGASRGVGPVIAEALARRGAHIALAARSEEGLRNVSKALSEFGVRTIVVPVDLAQAAQRQGLVSSVLEQFGSIDILIDETIEVNLVAPMALTYLVLPHMLRQKTGHIVNMASMGAKSGGPYGATYCGTKAGLAEWTRGLRLELADTGVHFSTIFPGYITQAGMFARFGMTPPLWSMPSRAKDWR